MTSSLLRLGPARAEQVRKLHGVNNGPVAYGGLVDVSDLYRDAEIPFVRLHDPNWPHAWEVDIHTIFPDFSRDPADPSSYDFARTDDYVASVVATGARVIYRLGESIEHTATKYFVHPPEDSSKWAQVCLGIIRHYNEGWANGFTYGISHWEIWNEADNPDPGVMWSGSDEDYFELYATAARTIKSAFPHLKIGGPACTMINESHTREFLRRCRDERLPLDFFSWHTYASDVRTIIENAHRVDGWLDEFGFAGIEIHLNEWNYIAPPDDEPDPREARRHIFDGLKGPQGASFAAAVLCALQDTRVDVANYYDGQPRAWYCGLFDDYGAPLPTYLAFRQFALFGGAQRCGVSFEGTARDLYALAVLRGGATELLVVNPTKDSLECRIAGLEGTTRLRATDVLTPSRTFTLADSKLVALPWSVTLIQANVTTDHLIET